MAAIGHLRNRAHGARPQGRPPTLWERPRAYFPGLNASSTLPGCAPQLA